MTERHKEARDSVPIHMRACFDLLVEDYKFAALTQVGTRMISYKIIAALVRAGWRRSGKEE